MNPSGFQTPVSSSTAFNIQQNSQQNFIENGAMEIPVKLQDQSVSPDATMSGYETPSFLAKKHKKIPNQKIKLHKMPMMKPHFIANNAADARKLRAQKNRGSTKIQQQKALNAEKQRLRYQAKILTSQVSAEVNNLLSAKNIGTKLNTLLQKYTLKQRRDQLSKLRLVDRVQIKKELKAKLIKEVEGFRTNGEEFNAVKSVDLKRIVSQIKRGLGY